MVFLLIFSQVLLQIYEVGPPRVLYSHHSDVLRAHLTDSYYVYADLHICQSVRKCTKKISWNINRYLYQHCQEIVGSNHSP